jgi:uncharacterized membrane protein YkoI
MSSDSPRLKRILATFAVVVGAGVGAAGIAAAASNTGSSSASVTADDQDQEPSYHSSVQLPENDNQSEADEAKSLEASAKISPDQARQAALATVPGTAGKVSLDNENGNVVYSVEITANGTTTDVKVDAGNGAVLAKDIPDNESNDGAETPSRNETPKTTGK